MVAVWNLSLFAVGAHGDVGHVSEVVPVQGLHAVRASDEEPVHIIGYENFDVNLICI